MLKEILFIGVGEACDPDYPNTSLLLKDQAGQGQILLDCGFTTPHRYFRHCSDPEELQALWISHFHGDHFFGVPLLLLRFWEMGRQSPLHILGPQGVEEKIGLAMELAYPKCMAKLHYGLHFLAVEPGRSHLAAGLTWNTAEIEHSQRALGVRIEDKKKVLFYSGDGRPTPETLDLAAGSDLVIHEAFRLSGETPGHGNVHSCIDFAKKSGAKKLALLHINRNERAGRQAEILEIIRQTVDLQIFLPEPGDLLGL